MSELRETGCALFPSPRARVCEAAAHCILPSPPVLRRLPVFPLRFYCQLSARDLSASSASTLSVIETNAFKQLTHLQLGLRVANDAGVKRYLAARLALANQSLSSTNEALVEKRRDAAALTEQLKKTGEPAVRRGGPAASPCASLP